MTLSTLWRKIYALFKRPKTPPDAIISILSHEMRTPLTSIYGALGLILTEQGLSEKVRELLLIASRNTERLQAIVQKISDAGSLQTGALKMDIKPISLIPLVKEAVALWQPKANQKGVVFVDTLPSQELFVLADFHCLLQVCSHLFSNAIKFSVPGGKVTLSLQVVDHHARISVEDRGPGIAPAFQDRLFTPFSQASQGDTKEEGTGLSLLICKGVIDQLGGDIGFTTKEGVGATFYFELPLI